MGKLGHYLVKAVQKADWTSYSQLVKEGGAKYIHDLSTKQAKIVLNALLDGHLVICITHLDYLYAVLSRLPVYQRLFGLALIEELFKANTLDDTDATLLGITFFLPKVIDFMKTFKRQAIRMINLAYQRYLAQAAHSLNLSNLEQISRKTTLFLELMLGCGQDTSTDTSTKTYSTHSASLPILLSQFAAKSMRSLCLDWFKKNSSAHALTPVKRIVSTHVANHKLPEPKQKGITHCGPLLEWSFMVQLRTWCKWLSDARTDKHMASLLTPPMEALVIHLLERFGKTVKYIPLTLRLIECYLDMSCWAPEVIGILINLIQILSREVADTENATKCFAKKHTPPQSLMTSLRVGMILPNEVTDCMHLLVEECYYYLMACIVRAPYPFVQSAMPELISTMENLVNCVKFQPWFNQFLFCKYRINMLLTPHSLSETLDEQTKLREFLTPLSMQLASLSRIRQAKQLIFTNRKEIENKIKTNINHVISEDESSDYDDPIVIKNKKRQKVSPSTKTSTKKRFITQISAPGEGDLIEDLMI